MPEKVIGSRAEVFHGTADHTRSGLDKSDLMKNKHGRIVSKAKNKLGKENEWAKAIKHASKKLPDGSDFAKIAKEAKKYYSKKDKKFTP
jgi:hypothetical protein